MKIVWMIRAAGGDIVQDFLETSTAAIGWSELGDIIT